MTTTMRISKSDAVTDAADRNGSSETKARFSKGNARPKKSVRRGATAAPRKAPPRTSATTHRGKAKRKRIDSDLDSASFRAGSKSNTIIELLKRKDGATIAELIEATGWQAHSVRGFLSGTLRKKLGMDIASDKEAAGRRRYRIVS